MADILCISTTDWSEIWGSRQQVMTRLVDLGNRVLFIERQIGLEHLIRDPMIRFRKRNTHSPVPRVVKEGLWIFNPPTLLPGRYYSTIINRISQQYLAIRLRTLLELLNFNRPILWIYPPHSAPLLGKFNEQLSIYYCIDRFSAGQRGVKKLVIEAEEQALVKNVDCIFVHSRQIQEMFYQQTSKPIHFMPSAADVTTFQSTSEIQPEIIRLPQPRLGIVGTLDARIDTQLLVRIAQAKPEWQLVLIGHTRPGIPLFNTLLQNANVHWFGSQPFSSLPRWMNGMDLFLIPYVVNDLTKCVHPLKVYEYLAVGKPIVSTDLPEIRHLKPWIDIAQDEEHFINAIKKGLADNSQKRIEERRKIAQQHDWNNRVALIWEIIEDILGKDATLHRLADY
jgi:glycosyltransferase involved in cell wall biosynthesis